jgi:hypothetical protein
MFIYAIGKPSIFFLPMVFSQFEVFFFSFSFGSLFSTPRFLDQGVSPALPFASPIRTYN